MLTAIIWLVAACLAVVLVCLATLRQLRQRVAALSRIEDKLDLLLAKAGIEYDPWAHVSQELREALRRGDKITAIKCYRQASGVGLKDAKDYVEELQRRVGL
jgi:ribosomal protein L7/L12